MNKLLIINQDSGYLMIDLANALSDGGFDVSLLTGRLVQRNTPLHASISLDRIIKYRRKSILSKVTSWIIGSLQIFFKVRFKYRKHYLLVVSNPPIAPVLPLMFKNPYSLLIYDVYIEKPEEFPLLNARSVPVKIWKTWHSKSFANAKAIFTLTAGMAAAIEKYSRDRKCVVVPIWSDNEYLKPIPAEKNPFKKNLGLNGKFVIMYSGSLGESCGVENLIEAAAHVDADDIVFLIVGEGSKKSSLQKLADDLGLGNCIFLPWQEVDQLPYSISSADLAVITLASKVSNNAIPSKLFSFMSVGAPVLCLAERSSDVGKLVEQERIGKCFPPASSGEIVDFIFDLYSNPDRAKMFGQNSLTLSGKFSKANAGRFVEEINHHLG